MSLVISYEKKVLSGMAIGSYTPDGTVVLFRRYKIPKNPEADVSAYHRLVLVSWLEEHLRQAEESKITPLVWDYAQVSTALLELFGPEDFLQYFNVAAYDLLGLARFLNARAVYLTKFPRLRESKLEACYISAFGGRMYPEYFFANSGEKVLRQIELYAKMCDLTDTALEALPPLSPIRK